MNEVKIIILPEETKQYLLDKYNKYCNTSYKIKDIDSFL